MSAKLVAAEVLRLLAQAAKEGAEECHKENMPRMATIYEGQMAVYIRAWMLAKNEAKREHPEISNVQFGAIGLDLNNIALSARKETPSIPRSPLLESL